MSASQDRTELWVGLTQYIRTGDVWYSVVGADHEQVSPLHARFLSRIAAAEEKERTLRNTFAHTQAEITRLSAIVAEIGRAAASVDNNRDRVVIRMEIDQKVFRLARNAEEVFEFHVEKMLKAFNEHLNSIKPPNT